MAYGIYMRKNRKGFTIVEFAIGLAVIAMLVVAVYLFQQTDTTPDTNNTTLEPTIEVYPTAEPIQTDSTDAELNATAEDINNLSTEINKLDVIDAELSLPNVDLSVE